MAVERRWNGCWPHDGNLSSVLRLEHGTRCQLQATQQETNEVDRMKPLFVLKRRGQKVSRICLQCGKFSEQGSNSKYCSNRCGWHYRKEHGTSIRGAYNQRNCEICQKSFFVNKWMPYSKYCSQKCAFKGQRATRHKGMIRSRSKEYKCRECNKTNLCGLIQRRKFCDQQCYWRWRRANMGRTRTID
jgi:hypothetical protein